MAVSNGTITNVFQYQLPIGTRRTSAGKPVECCFLTAIFGGTYAQTDNAQITAIPAVLQASMKNNKTIEIVDACFVAPGDEAGSIVGAKSVAVSAGTTITLELTQGDLSTEHANGALGTFNVPLCFCVSYTTNE